MRFSIKSSDPEPKRKYFNRSRRLSLNDYCDCGGCARKGFVIVMDFMMMTPRIKFFFFQTFYLIVEKALHEVGGSDVTQGRNFRNLEILEVCLES